MITIIHGTDIVSSRKYFTDIKEKQPDSSIIAGDKVSLTDLVQIFEGGGLFGDTKSVFIESLLGKKKDESGLKEIIKLINGNSKTSEIVLWEDREVTSAALGKFKESTARIFKLPQPIFLFLDSIKPGNGHELVRLFNKTLSEADAEMIFFMLVRQFRLMLSVKDQGHEQIDEMKRITWQMGKLKNQAAFFDKNYLKNLYAKLFELEVAQKTGTLSMTLPQAIDFFLLEI